MHVLAPAQPGRYLLRATLVQEYVRWFDDVDRANGWEQYVEVTEARGLERSGAAGDH